MSSSGESYITAMRSQGLNDEDIRQRMQSAGWASEDVNQAFASVDDELPPPPPAPAHQNNTSSIQSDRQEGTKPIAVVQQYSTRGIEYAIMFFSLGIGAVALGNLLHYLLDSALDPRQQDAYFSAESIALPATAALVTIPIFVFLFLRLCRAEKTESDLRRDSSRRKWIQVTLLVTFLWGIWAFVFNFYKLLLGNQNSIYDSSCFREPSIYEGACAQVATMSDTTFVILQLLHMAITLAIAGSIFAYWCIDEHRQK